VAVGAACLRAPSFLAAQEPPEADSVATAPFPADSGGPVAGQEVGAPAGTAADSAALDSLEAEIARELGADTVAAPTAAAAPAPVRGGGQSLNPDISVIGDFLVDLSPDESTLEEGDRFAMREVELGLQAAVDPFFRADFFLGLHGDVIELEEGYLTTLSLPHGLQARAGRFHLPFGKVNLTHRPELHTVEYPLVIQDFFGEEGFASTGLWASKILAPLGFYQELIAVVGNDLGEDLAGGHAHDDEGGPDAGEEDGDEDGEDDAGGRDLLEDLGDRLFLGHLKNYVDLSEAANLEVGVSAATGAADPADADSERLTFYGVDAIYRWRPPAAGLYRSLILQAEAVWRDAEEGTDFGAFAFAQVQLGRRWYLGARLDRVDGLRGEPEADGSGISGYLTLYPSEFSLFRVGVEHREIAGDDLDRVLVQATVTLGPHRPHPF
jgi:hypothetical protein